MPWQLSNLIAEEFVPCSPTVKYALFGNHDIARKRVFVGMSVARRTRTHLRQMDVADRAAAGEWP
jgi:hypothetical protein